MTFSKSKIFRRTSAGAVAALTLVSVVAPVAANASTDDLSQRVGAILEQVPDEYGVLRENVTSSGNERRASAFDPTANPLTVTNLSGATVSIQLNDEDHAQQSASLDGARTAFAYPDDYIAVPQPKTDGSVQLITILESKDSPSTFSYTLEVPDGAALQKGDTGDILIVSNSGEYIAAVSAPWAVDSAGTPVPTDFNVSGLTITQSVAHTEGDYAYPIVADPWLGSDLYYWPTVDYVSSGYVINAVPTYFGEIHQGPQYLWMWWAHADEINSRTSPAWTTTIQEQLYCHIGGYPAGMPEYNMESWRRLVYWESSLALFGCNP